MVGGGLLGEMPDVDGCWMGGMRDGTLDVIARFYGVWCNIAIWMCWWWFVYLGLAQSYEKLSRQVAVSPAGYGAVVRWIIW